MLLIIFSDIDLLLIIFTHIIFFSLNFTNVRRLRRDGSPESVQGPAAGGLYKAQAEFK